MSCERRLVQPLTKDDIQKAIVAPLPVIHDVYEFLNNTEKFRDEEYEIYNRKKGQFLDEAKKYLVENKHALNSIKPKVNDILEDLIPKSFELEDPPKIDKNISDGIVIRKRTIRKNHEIPNYEIKQVSTEPWYRRLLLLNKFINVGRKVMLQNRLIKRLEILKKLTQEDVEEFEKNEKKYENISYKELFQQFVK